MKKLDLFIIKKFLSTFFFILGVILAIAVVIDISEKIDDFLKSNPPLNETIIDYYINFLFFYGNLFTPLFVFLTVIFFTSQMAYKSEIVAILSSGVSFNRFLLPFFVAATILAILSGVLNHWIVPYANKTRLKYEEKYILNKFDNLEKHIHRQVKPGEFIYMDSFSVTRNTGYKFSYEIFKDNKLRYKLMADYIRWDTTNSLWHIENYKIRSFDDEGKEYLETGNRIDTAYTFDVDEFKKRKFNVQMMATPELIDYIDEEKMKGSELISLYEVEKHQRTSFPFATYILTLIGVSFASRKVRGGIGLHIAISIGICFSYILTMQVSTVYAVNAGLTPILAVWMPNILFGILAIYFYVRAPK